MNSYFVTSLNITAFLFEGWDTNGNIGALFLICFFVFCMVLLLEGLRMVVLFLQLKEGENPLTRDTDTIQHHPDHHPRLTSLSIPSSLDAIKTRRYWLYTGETITHVLTVILGYLLMLSIMTRNVWITIALLIGSGLGFYIFGGIRHHLEAIYLPEPYTKLIERSETSTTSQQQHGQMEIEIMSPHIIET